MTAWSAQAAIVATGAVSSCGRDWPSTWRALLAGKWQADRPPCVGVPVASGPASFVGDLDRQSGRPTAFLARAVLAQLAHDPDEPAALYGATNHGETDVIVSAHRSAFGAREQWDDVLFEATAACSPVQRRSWIYSACTSGMHALAAACLDLSADGPDALVVAADALSPVALTGFSQARATTRTRCAPLQQQRDGMLVGEGAAGIRLRSAARVPSGSLGVLGIGMSCDAGHPTDPDPTGRWLRAAIDDALARAGVAPSSIAGVVAHGTGTVKNDAAEATVYRDLWPDRSIPVTSIKGAIGHTMGAAGLFNVLAAAQARCDGVLPPAIGHGSAPIDGVDLVLDVPRPLRASGPLLAVASGFGGNNVVCVVGTLR